MNYIDAPPIPALGFSHWQSLNTINMKYAVVNLVDSRRLNVVNGVSRACVVCSR